MSGLAACSSETTAAQRMLPQPAELAALGVVLCLYRVQSGGELAGWSQAVRAQASAKLDSDGLCERLVFHDGADRCCWQLFLLPDSHFLTWDRLTSRLPSAPDPSAGTIAERLWRRLADGLRGPPWQASVLRLQVPRTDPGFGAVPGAVLAASLATVSATGAATATRIATREGVDAAHLLHDCCCERAARAAARASPDCDPAAGPAYSLIRLNTRPQP
jgi:hypothetical protein